MLPVGGVTVAMRLVEGLVGESDNVWDVVKSHTTGVGDLSI